ncbi:MAG: glycosyltransferase family 39 protein [Vicinamibacterales bacterium]
MKRFSALLLLLLLWGGLAAVRSVLEREAGLAGTFSADRAWGREVRQQVSPRLTTAALDRAWDSAPPERFRARWTGFLIVSDSGWYRVATISDDEAIVTVDGLAIEGADRSDGGRIRLSRGAHEIAVDYGQIGGAYHLEVLWGRDGESLEAIPESALWRRPVSSLRANAAWILGPLSRLSLLALVLCAIWAFRRDLRRWALGVSRLDWGLLLVLAFGAYFRFLYIDLPMADAHGWRQLFNADVARNFDEQSLNIWYPRVSWGGAGDGLVSMEFPLLSWLAAVVLRIVGQGHIDLVCRIVTVVFSMATMVGAYGLATLLWGRAVGRGAAFLLAISPSAIFFGRAFISDTPMVCFSVFGVWGFVAYLKTGSRRALTWGTVTAALACMVKLPGVVLMAPIAWMAWETRRWRAITDLPLVAGVSAVLLATVVWYGHAEMTFAQTYLGVAIFHPVGGYSPEVMDGAGPLTLVTSWNTTAQLSNPEYYQALAERFWYLHFTPIGTVVILLGAVLCFRAPHRRFVDAWFAGVAVFILMAAEGNRWHEFYQLPILLPASMYFGLAARPAFDEVWLSTRAPWRLGIVASAVALVLIGLDGFERSRVVPELFRPFALRMTPISVGDQLQELTPPDALLVTVEYERFGGNSPVLFYYARRRGWSFDATALTPVVLERLHHTFGARYFVTTIWSQLAERQPEVAAYLKTQREIPLTTPDAALFALQ